MYIHFFNCPFKSRPETHTLTDNSCDKVAAMIFTTYKAGVISKLLKNNLLKATAIFCYHSITKS